jgi:tetratricopeptide (TPR) repeat protein
MMSACLSALPNLSRLGGIVLLAISLGGCITDRIGFAGGRVAETDTDKQAANVNIASLTEVITRNPTDANAYNTRGAAYARITKYKEAIADFTKAVALRPGFAAAFTNRALAYREIEKDDEALADFNRAVQAGPTYGPAFLGRGNLFRVKGRFDEAISDLTQAIRLDANSAQAYHARGLIYQRQNLHQRAVTDFDAAIDRNPFVPAPYLARGQSLIALSKFDAAIEDFNACLNLDNNLADGWAGLGLAFEKKGDVEQAKTNYDRALIVDSNNVLAREGIARLNGQSSGGGLGLGSLFSTKWF